MNHKSAFYGRLDVVARLLDEGVDPNEPHTRDANAKWVCGPSALNKAISAWSVTTDHVAIARLLIERGAKTDQSHFDDLAALAADSVGSPNDAAMLHLLQGMRS